LRSLWFEGNATPKSSSRSRLDAGRIQRVDEFSKGRKFEGRYTKTSRPIAVILRLGNPASLLRVIETDRLEGSIPLKSRALWTKVVRIGGSHTTSSTVGDRADKPVSLTL
jgi:hypothetical protein